MFSSLNIFSCLGLSLVFSTLVHSEPNVITKRTPLDIQPVSEQVTIDPLGAYVRACHLDDGSIIAGYSTTIDNGAQKVQPIAKSTDGGLTWNQIGQVVQNQTSTSDVANAFPLQLPSGRILFAYRNHDLNPDRSYATYRITLSYSDDGGSTWAYLSDVDVRQATAIKNGLWEPFIRVAANGEVQVYYSAESADLVQTVLMRSSADSGLTWSDSIVASVGATNDTRDGMPGVANLDDNGNLIMFFENTEVAPGTYSVDYVFSSDDGSTWGGRSRLYTYVTRAAAPQVVNLGDVLVASFQTYNYSAPNTNPDMLVATSTDSGQTWDIGPRNVTATNILWPGLLGMDNNTFLALTGNGQAGGAAQLYQVLI